MDAIDTYEKMKKMRGKKPATKTMRILRHLITHKRGITSMEAFEKYNTTRLSAIIFDLRTRHSLAIDTVMVAGADGGLYARYVLKEG